MTTFYSDYHCLKCNNDEKILVDYEDGFNHLAMPGQPSEVNELCDTICPYCNADNKSNIISKNGVFVGIIDAAFLCLKLETPSYEKTISKWKNEKRTLFLFDEPFKNHPYPPEAVIVLGDKKLTVKQTFIREWIEPNPDIRLEVNKDFSYCYALADEEGNDCWLQVEKGDLDNAQLNYKDGFILRDNNDVILDISDDTAFPLEIFKSDWIDDLELSVNQFKSGYQFLVTNSKNELTFNGFYTSFEEGFEEFEANITLTM